MSFSVSPTQDEIFKTLGTFLAGILDPSVKIEVGQTNRVPEPPEVDYILMWPLRIPRLATNIEEYIDAVFTGSITGTTLDITAVDPNFTGQLVVGSTLFGVDVAESTTITALVSGSGGLGTYTVSTSQTAASATIAAGVVDKEQKAEVVIQIDVHGPNSTDNSSIISTLYRDYYAVDTFAFSGFPITPLYVDDPRQTPFLNAEQGYEDRYTIDAHMQVDFTVTIPQEFATSLVLGLIPADVIYPAS